MVRVGVSQHLASSSSRSDSEADTPGGGGGPDPALLHTEVTLIQDAPGHSEDKEMSGNIHQQSHRGLPEESSRSQFIIEALKLNLCIILMTNLVTYSKEKEESFKQL